MTDTEYFENFKFSLAHDKDNQDIIDHVKANPINMDINYIMDRHDDFFKLHKLHKGSIVLIARNVETNDLCACISILKFKGNIASDQLSYQYITDLIKDVQNGAPLLMQKLLNFGLKNYFDTDLIFGIINENNYRARHFSGSKQFLFPPQIIASFHYYEIVPFRKQKFPKYINFCCATEAQLDDSLRFINSHYKNHLLFKNLDHQLMSQMFEFLPNFSLQNIILAYVKDHLCGVMIYYDPSEIVSLIIDKTDRKTSIVLKAMAVINRVTGLMVSPPGKGDKIKTLQLRYLAGEEAIRSQLLLYAENLAFTRKYHSVSFLIDVKEKIRFRNKFYFKYKSLMYLSHKKAFESKIKLFSDWPVFLDISYT